MGTLISFLNPDESGQAAIHPNFLNAFFLRPFEIHQFNLIISNEYFSVASPAGDDAILLKYLILIQRQLSFQRIVRMRDDTILFALLNKSKQSSIFCSVASSPAGDDAILKIPDSNSPTIKFPAHRPQARRCYTFPITIYMNGKILNEFW